MDKKIFRKHMIYITLNEVSLSFIIALIHFLLNMTFLKKYYAPLPPMKHEIMLAIIVAPIAEEVIFRKWIFKFLKKRTKYYNFIQATLFSLWHYNFFQRIYAFILGIFFGNIIRKYEKIWITIIFHSFYNLLSIYLRGYYFLFIENIFGTRNLLTFFVLYVPSIIFFIWTLKKLGYDMYKLW
ncbi:CPBP family intramembrane metalloprotease [Leptotrichia sp. OH3620_COT-345]|uniref:CPBP family intramembrane glutamic endopeptidase n=1 Tax=Leptotrichia sp. OH3620_COT-345 TaxID=2491048 RepID=UPI000F645D20|nr:CPBP family intramembrane glutamic endopeptidase [Leptotrichia sp. OH3620_COT-345]RRD38093.1 CPBP family intramembrane metalloprotease [Leptotrichia sp. OH3620_COT-345]